MYSMHLGAMSAYQVLLYEAKNCVHVIVMGLSQNDVQHVASHNVCTILDGKQACCLTCTIRVRHT